MATTNGTNGAPRSGYVSAREAVRQSGITRHRLLKMALLGRIRHSALPGELPRYCLADCHAIVAGTDPDPVGHRQVAGQVAEHRQPVPA